MKMSLFLIDMFILTTVVKRGLQFRLQSFQFIFFKPLKYVEGLTVEKKKVTNYFLEILQFQIVRWD